MEDNFATVVADGVFSEAYGMALDREYVHGMHNVGTAVFNGMVYNTMATGFRGLVRSTAGPGNLVPAGGGGRRLGAWIRTVTAGGRRRRRRQRGGRRGAFRR